MQLLSLSTLWLLAVIMMLCSMSECVSGSKVYPAVAIDDLLVDVEATLEMAATDRSFVYALSSFSSHSVLSHLNHSALPITEKDFFCFDVSIPGDEVLEEIDALALKRSRGSFPFTVLLVTGVEKLQSEKEVGKLNFLHSVTDANSMYANLVVILNWDTSKRSVPQHSNEMEEFLINFFSQGGAKMNPEALYGRISFVSMGSTPDFDTLNAEFPCGNFGDAHYQVNTGEEQEARSNVMAVVVALCMSFLLLYIYFSASKPAIATTGTAMNSPAATRKSSRNDEEKYTPELGTPRRSSRLSKMKKKD